MVFGCWANSQVSSGHILQHFEFAGPTLNAPPEGSMLAMHAAAMHQRAKPAVVSSTGTFLAAGAVLRAPRNAAVEGKMGREAVEGMDIRLRTFYIVPIREGSICIRCLRTGCCYSYAPLASVVLVLYSTQSRIIPRQLDHKTTEEYPTLVLHVVHTRPSKLDARLLIPIYPYLLSHPACCFFFLSHARFLSENPIDWVDVTHHPRG